ncbi:hypothetical protein IE077_003633, partial [Cardiosporidium cionae]
SYFVCYFCSVIADLVVSKAEQIRIRARLSSTPEPFILQKLSESYEKNSNEGVNKEVILHCFRHLGDCFKLLYRRFMDNQTATVCRNMCENLMNSCLSTEDISLHFFIFEWIVQEGLGAFPKPVIQLDSPFLAKWLQNNKNLPELELGEYYVISRQYKQAVEFYYKKSIVEWQEHPLVPLPSIATQPSVALHAASPSFYDVGEEGEGGEALYAASSRGWPRPPEAAMAASPPSSFTNAKDTEGILLGVEFQPVKDPFCLPESHPLWETCTRWLQQNLQEPSLSHRRAFLQKALEVSSLQQR